jgi:hypothetical protein
LQRKSAYRVIEIVGGVAAGILGIVLFTIALRITKPRFLSFGNILAGALFYGGPSLLVTIAAFIHVAKRESRGTSCLSGRSDSDWDMFVLHTPIPTLG